MKRSPRPSILLASADGDLSDDITTDPELVNYYDSVSFSFVWSGGSSPVGTWKIQVSNDTSRIEADVASGSWEDVPGLNFALSGASGVEILNILENVFEWARAVFTSTSGSGLCEVTVKKKGL